MGGGGKSGRHESGFFFGAVSEEFVAEEQSEHGPEGAGAQKIHGQEITEGVVGEGFFCGGTGTFHLDRPRSRYELRMVARPDLELSGENMQHFSLLGLLLSEDVLRKAPVDIVLCDHRLRDLKLIKMAPPTAGYQQLLEAMRAAIKEKAAESTGK